MKVSKKVKAVSKPKMAPTIKKKKPIEAVDGKKVKKVKEATENGTAVAALIPKKTTKKVKEITNGEPATKTTKKSKAITNGAVKKDAKKATKKNSVDKSVEKKPKKSHMEELEGLKDIDPEFYKFLKQNDKELLEFNLLDSDDDDEDNEGDEAPAAKNTKETKKKNSKAAENSDEEAEGEADDDDDSDEENDDKFHKPGGDLEVASDESDFEDNDEALTADGSQKITLNLLRQWQIQLEKPNVSIEVVRKVIQAFNSALASISGGDEQFPTPTAYKVVGAAAFNGVVQLCVLHLQPAVLRLLGLKPRSTIPLHKTKKWVKVRGCLRYYLTDLIRLVEQISSANILSVLLKHLHQMAGMVASFSTLGKTILKRLIVLWSTGDETVRVLAFLCILKITRNQQTSMLHHVLKAMYLSYVRNSKFVSPNTLPGINFMRRSLVEMFALDLNASYQHAFLYIRQLAIHLRNAVILKKKDSFQAIYNWQYVNSLRLWADLLGASANKPQLQPLVYPLVTIAIGAIRLIPTAQYFPMRFHCIQSLIVLAKETNTFIPVLPLILEVLRSNTFNRKHTAVSMRPLQFTCILRLNKQQLSENGFRDEVVEQVCGLTLEFLAHESASLAFSDLVVPTIVSIKAYLKECRNANHSRKLKQLLDKIQENTRFVDQERRKINFGLKDVAQVQAWEVQLRNKGTPLGIYYSSWVKTHETKKRRQAAQSDSINADYDVPMIKRTKGAKGGVAVRNENGEVELFPSDSEDDMELPVPEVAEDDDEEEAAPPTKKDNKKEKSKSEKTSKKAIENVEVNVPLEEPDVDEGVDIVKDLDLDDW